jgi:hypothetical protein
MNLHAMDLRIVPHQPQRLAKIIGIQIHPLALVPSLSHPVELPLPKISVTPHRHLETQKHSYQ